uniref:Uncharacterized protein n=1 Tax=Physcomitrium patens TaxID=3218 RepID=A0A2K1KHZ2_PHYPA|nr:hypothetical protein PHYPA_007075 [Physcomitrium patens]
MLTFFMFPTSTGSIGWDVHASFLRRQVGTDKCEWQAVIAGRTRPDIPGRRDALVLAF